MVKTSHLFLIFIPLIILTALGLLIRIVQHQPLNPSDEEVAAFSASQKFHIPILPNDPIIGEKNAPVTLIVFEDFACRACKEQTAILDRLSEKHPNRIKRIWKGLPVTTFPFNGEEAHIFGFCANKQGVFAQYKQLAFVNGNNLDTPVLQTIQNQLPIDVTEFSLCLNGPEAKAHIEYTKQIAKSLNIQAVPAMFKDNKQIPMQNSVEAWEQYLGLLL